MKISEVSKLKLTRIHIIGNPASGKTYLARILSQKLKAKHYDLDDITFKRKYDLKRTTKERARILKKICARKRWVTEGAYWRWIGEALKKSDIIVWLDFPLSITTFRIIKRYLGRKFIDRMGRKEDLRLLLKYSFRYKFGKEAAYPNFKKAVKSYKRKVILIRSSREFDNLIRAINQKDL